MLQELPKNNSTVPHHWSSHPRSALYIEKTGWLPTVLELNNSNYKNDQVLQNGNKEIVFWNMFIKVKDWHFQQMYFKVDEKSSYESENSIVQEPVKQKNLNHEVRLTIITK